MRGVSILFRSVEDAKIETSSKVAISTFLPQDVLATIVAYSQAQVRDSKKKDFNYFRAFKFRVVTGRVTMIVENYWHFKGLSNTLHLKCLA